MLRFEYLNSEIRKYDVKEADIYQMYGSRYSTTLEKPQLELIYPRNPNFQTKLQQFRYGEDIYLDVLPFDFGNINPQEEINKIVNLF